MFLSTGVVKNKTIGCGPRSSIRSGIIYTRYEYVYVRQCIVTSRKEKTIARRQYKRSIKYTQAATCENEKNDKKRRKKKMQVDRNYQTNKITNFLDGNHDISQNFKR